MFRNALLILLTLTIAIGGGAASAWYALGSIGALDTIQVGGWVAYPDAGTPQADPYAKARIAREASLPLGQAEGLPFFASRDAGGELLRRDCDYRIEGQFPQARFWTLQVALADRLQRAVSRERSIGINSFGVLRNGDNTVTISASRSVSPGNWLPVIGAGPMTLVLTFYDTPIASNQNIMEIFLPEVLRVRCDA
jgi:hypothetical protein